MELKNETRVQDNGSHAVGENGDNHDVLNKEKGNEVSKLVSSSNQDVNSEVSNSPTMTAKGFGLKKWRRIRRDVSVTKSGDSSVDTGKTVVQNLPMPVANPSKRPQIYAERNGKSVDSVSDTKDVIKSLEKFALVGGSRLGVGPSSLDAGIEYSVDRGTNSSTAASVRKMKFEMPVVVGVQGDKSKMRSLSGKNLNHTVHRGHQEKVRIETMKKEKGERVKIEKESSLSSVESDLRCSKFVFAPGIYATNNGVHSETSVDYDGENGDEVEQSERPVADGFLGGFGKDGEGGYKNMSPEGVVADSSCEVKEERSENHASSTAQDPLVESIIALQLAQEALEKEVLKFKEIGKDASVDDSVSDINLEFTDIEQRIQEIRSEQFPSGEDIQSSSLAVQPEVVGTANRDDDTEIEILFKQKIEAEVEYLAISGTVQNLRVAAVDQITLLAEEKALALEQTQILDKLGDTKNKDMMPKKEAEKMENLCEVNASADETLKLRKRVRKYTSYLILQLVLLVLFAGVYIFQSSTNHLEVVPT